ncbi:MAG TPA: SHOCT domain-containing protein [Streptosporangiaceae bacterium]|nr:SHOCT domain-containing protein [Streptosporangiaceae bacterium]
MFRRRPLMRAAVVGGGAYMAGKAHARNQAEQAQYQADQDARISNLEQQQADQQQGYQQQDPPQYQEQQQPPPPQAPPPAASSPMIDQLNQLAALHQQGVLTDDEFSAAKAKLFGT